MICGKIEGVVTGGEEVAREELGETGDCLKGR